MKPVNIYALTRINRPDDIMRLERQMSGRHSFMKVKPWEVDDLKLFAQKLLGMAKGPSVLYFYYSFVMPRLGKEFDLLRVGRSYVLNVELKSRAVPYETVKKQLLQNRHYLSALGLNVYSYTFLRESDQLVRLSNSGRLIESDWEELMGLIEGQGSCFDGDIELLFREDRYLISPLTDPGRFLRKEYFLTWQQMDIKKKMLEKIRQAFEDKDSPPIQGFTGYPGTGKTLLLYDLAMELSQKDRVCVFHFGSHEKELEELDDRLKRVDYYYCEGNGDISIEKDYRVIFVDEGHRLTQRSLGQITDLSEKWNAPVIISYDREDDIHPSEREFEGADIIEAIPGYTGYFLTNRIRLNSELSTFIRRLVHPGGGNHKKEYPSVTLMYSQSEEETYQLFALLGYENYFYIYDEEDTEVSQIGKYEELLPCIGAMEATCKEYDRVVMRMDRGFYYDDSGYLRYNGTGPTGGQLYGRVRKLFHGLSRAKEKIALVVDSDPELFEAVLSMLQAEAR
ncbi:MAG: ATP-binding protein [Lachnospiraceae bacterium]|nr:ATP-binding protein [Lachnospiraceae bacterium]